MNDFYFHCSIRWAFISNSLQHNRLGNGIHERQTTVYFIGSIQPAQGAKNGARNSWILDKIIVNTSEGNIDRAVIVVRMRRRQHGFYGQPSWLMVAVSACLLHTANPAQKRSATTTYNNAQDPPTHGCCCTNDKLFNYSADLRAACPVFYAITVLFVFI